MEQVAGAFESRLYVRCNVVFADMIHELGPVQKMCGLMAGAAKDQRPARAFEPVGKYLQRVKAGSVDCRHVSQTKNDD